MKNRGKKKGGTKEKTCHLTLMGGGRFWKLMGRLLLIFVTNGWNACKMVKGGAFDVTQGQGEMEAMGEGGAELGQGKTVFSRPFLGN